MLSNLSYPKIHRHANEIDAGKKPPRPLFGAFLSFKELVKKSWIRRGGIFAFPRGDPLLEESDKVEEKLSI